MKKADIYKWNVLLKGPNKSCYENGLFKLSLIFPINYPEDPPNIKFITKIFYPYISNYGIICVSSKSKEWNQNRSIINVIYSIYALLIRPNLDHGLNKEALSLYKNDYESFKKKAKEFTEEYATKIHNNI